MTTIRLRPTFTIGSTLESADVLAEIQATIAASPKLNGKFKGQHGMVSFKDSARHFWSPWLHLEVRRSMEDESADIGKATQSEIFGRFSPHPSIWTAFAFGYLSLVALVFFSIVFGISQQLANQTPTGFYALPILAAIAVLLWCVSKVGQRLAQDDMKEMKILVESSLQD